MKLTVADIELLIIALDRAISRAQHEIKMGELGKSASNPVNVKRRLERMKRLRVRFLMLEVMIEVE